MLVAVHRQIHYYNHDRIHSVLKMTPAEFCEHSKIKRTVEKNADKMLFVQNWYLAAALSRPLASEAGDH
jgi:hypothetical protein